MGRPVYVNIQVLKELPDEFVVVIPSWNDDNKGIVNDNKGVFTINPNVSLLGTLYATGDWVVRLELDHVGRSFEVYLGEAFDELVDTPSELAWVLNLARRYPNAQGDVVALDYYRSGYNQVVAHRILGKGLGDIEGIRKSLEGWSGASFMAYLPYRVRKRVSKSGRYVNISGDLDINAKPEYIVVMLPSKDREISEVDVGAGEFLGYNDAFVYVILRPGTSTSVDVWSGNKVKSFIVHTEPYIHYKLVP